MKAVETFREALEKWRGVFGLKDIWTFEVVEGGGPSGKMTVRINYKACSSKYELDPDCPLDETDLNILALRQAICMLVSCILLDAMDDDEEDADALFHKAMMDISEVLTQVLGLSTIAQYEKLE